MNHKVSIRVSQSSGTKKSILEAQERRVHKRLLRFLLGKEMNVLVVSPGNTVNAIEIQEIQEGGVVT
jgi:hypothetical protein